MNFTLEELEEKLDKLRGYELENYLNLLIKNFREKLDKLLEKSNKLKDT